MQVVHTMESDFAYVKELVGAGLDGIASAREELYGGVFPSASQNAVWPPTALGAAIGLLSARLFAKRKSASTVAMGGLVGTILGCSLAVAWASRGFVVPATRGAARRVNAVRDAHWLGTHPIDYA
jgi:hypothetical protein